MEAKSKIRDLFSSKKWLGRFLERIVENPIFLLLKDLKSMT